MAWTAPRTWVTGETVTAALMNAHIRDNLLETSAATVTTAGDIAYADGNKSMGSRLAIGAANSHLVVIGSTPVWRAIATDIDTASGLSRSTGYKTLANLTPTPFAGEVEVTLTTGSEALVLIKARLSNDTAGSFTFLSYSVSGASTISAVDVSGIAYESSNNDDVAFFGGFDLQTALSAGSNVFTLEARISANDGTIQGPEIAVIPF